MISLRVVRPNRLVDRTIEADLERFHLRVVTSEDELVPLELHPPARRHCVSQAEEAAEYVDAIRAAMVATGQTVVILVRFRHAGLRMVRKLKTW